MCTGHRRLEGTAIRVDSRTTHQLSEAGQARDLLHGLYAAQEVVAQLTGPGGLGEWRKKAIPQVCRGLKINSPTLDELQSRLGKLEIPAADQDYLLNPLKRDK